MQGSTGLFRHGVASGDPLADRVVIWTRATTDDHGDLPMAWTVARDPGMGDVVASGAGEARADDDHTYQVDVTGLEPSTRYWYAFECGGERSATGRTKTLPRGRVDHLRFAQCSCSKHNAGFFNAYGRIADREDLDFVVHLGDYIYEAGEVPAAGQTPGADIGRPFEPRNECVTLADYRTRYGQYHADADAIRMHAMHPIIATLDDHELADGAWRDGSDAHVPERDGPWEVRRAAAFRARAEWTPTRRPDPADPTRIWRSMALGDLADLFLIDTRSRRDKPVRGEAGADPSRTQLGREQSKWLTDGMAASTAPWVILGNGSVISPLWHDDLPESVLPALLAMKLIHKDGKGPDVDQWDGYPAERTRIVDAIAATPASVVVLSGDIHGAVAAEVSRDPFGPAPEPVAVEFVTTSLTSQNLDDKMGWEPRTKSLAIEQELLAGWPHIRWCELDSHGYVVIDVTRERVVAEWWFVETVLRRTSVERLGGRWQVAHGRPRLVPG